MDAHVSPRRTAGPTAGRAQGARRGAKRFPVAAGALVACALAGACADDGGGDPGIDGPPTERATCVAPEGHDGSPETFEELVALIDALPRPVTLPCLLEVLERPLLVEATANTFSAQPADGPENPRIFIFRGEMVLSVVPDGGARHLLEMSLRRSPTRSVKGEILFPIEGAIEAADPYRRILYGGEERTKCFACHADEAPDPSVTHAPAFLSDIVAPHQLDRVDVAGIEAEHRACDPAEEPDRCAMLEALFGHGEVRHLSFDAW